MLYIVEYQGSRYGVFASSHKRAQELVSENHTRMTPLP